MLSVGVIHKLPRSMVGSSESADSFGTGVDAGVGVGAASGFVAFRDLVGLGVLIAAGDIYSGISF